MLMICMCPNVTQRGWFIPGALQGPKMRWFWSILRQILVNYIWYVDPLRWLTAVYSIGWKVLAAVTMKVIAKVNSDILEKWGPMAINLRGYHHHVYSTSFPWSFWLRTNLRSLLWALTGALRWKQSQWFCPTAVGDVVGAGQGCGSTLMALCCPTYPCQNQTCNLNC